MRRSTSSHSDIERKSRQRRREEWRNQQKLEREHERLKQKKILEYELKRCKDLGLPLPDSSLQRHRHSKSRSRSAESQHRRYPATSTSKPKISILSKQVDPTSGMTPIFKGPEGTEIRSAELRQIKVNIHRIIPTNAACSELQRDIVDPEDVVLKRRDGEGSKPIFERDEIQRLAKKPVEVEEHRTVINLERKPQTSKTTKRRSVSLSPPRRRSNHYSPRSTSSRSRHKEPIHERGRRRHRSRNRSRDRSFERKRVHTVDKRHVPSHSGEGQHRKSQAHSRRRSSMDDRYYRESHRRQSSDDRRGEVRERRIPQPAYIEQIPVPLYYGNFLPRPIMVAPPMVPFRGPVPMLRGRHPMMGPMRPFSPRFMSPDMYRLPGPSRGALPPW